VGARTGRDGIHGATFASEELSEDSDESSRPQVQVGDPFTEKLLLEASLELIASGAISGIQDMGAAGITSSASEMAGRGGSGVELEMTDVPVREDGMTPYEILLSESQERMLVVAHPGREDEVREILEKWELEAAVIGQVTDDGKFRILENGNVVGDIPALPLTDGCPTYEREGIESEEVIALREMDLTEHMTEEGDLTKDFLLLLRSPNVASKRWIYEQYDTTVRTGTAVRPGGDSGVVRIRGTKRAIAATTDCNGRLVYLEPRTGAMAAVAEAARNLVCVGALPTAITNNLNFGNPLKTHIYYQLREAVLGMREACSAFETPVTGGNVSLFNETDGKAIYPTPVIGMVGVIDDVSKIIHHAFKSAGDDIVLLGTNSGEIGGSEYLYVTSKLVAGNPPSLDLEAERLLQQAVLKMNHEEVLNSAHDCSQGGLAATLAECALGNGETPLGVSAEVDEDLAPIVSLFGESHGRIIASTSPDNTERVLALAALYDVPAKRIGTVTDMASGFSIKVRSGSVQARMTDLAEAYFGSIPNIMDAPTGSEA
ncbi:MAG TPA: phosphoribosylformylglycinamidine synthase subunit PurL, partial [Gemmatimonadetes bacterium]|nr:phosphoribosylformylglycinamidine synthase subunit PurL [Gemmatimonadota bacterium]